MTYCLNPKSEAHGGRCYCGRKALWHVAYGSGCGNVCGAHKKSIAKVKRGAFSAERLK